MRVRRRSAIDRLARRVGIDVDALKDIESVIFSGVSPRLLTALAKHLGTTEDALLLLPQEPASYEVETSKSKGKRSK